MILVVGGNEFFESKYWLEQAVRSMQEKPSKKLNTQLGEPGEETVFNVLRVLLPSNTPYKAEDICRT